MVENIQKLVELNNQFYSAMTLSLSIGVATSRPGDRLEDVVKRADGLMYQEKRAYYATEPRDRRRGDAVAAEALE